jgi:hypothetical protein
VQRRAQQLEQKTPRFDDNLARLAEAWPKLPAEPPSWRCSTRLSDRQAAAGGRHNPTIAVRSTAGGLAAILVV